MAPPRTHRPGPCGAKNREKWATPFTLLSPLPKRNIKRPWRGVGCQRSAPVFVRSLLPGTALAALCARPPVGQAHKRPPSGGSERTPLQKQKPHGTPGLRSPGQSSLFHLTCLGTCWRPAAWEDPLPLGRGSLRPRHPAHLSAGPREHCWSQSRSGPGTSVPRECSPAKERGRRTSLPALQGADAPWPRLGPQFTSQATDRVQSLFYTLRRVFLPELPHRL